MLKLKEIDMFKTLSPSNLEDLNSQLIVKSYIKDSIVFYEGDNSDYLHIVLEGKVKLYKTTPKGNQIQINRLSAPALIGEYACFEHQPFPATCEFVEDGVMGLLPFEYVYNNLSNSAFSLEIIKSLTAKVSLLTTLVHKETVLSSEAKVADLILNKPAIFSRLKNNEISSILNLTPETFSRILAKFKKEGIINYTKHNLEVINRPALNIIIETNKIKDCTNCIVEFKNKIGYKD